MEIDCEYLSLVERTPVLQMMAAGMRPFFNKQKKRKHKKISGCYQEKLEKFKNLKTQILYSVKTANSL